MTMNRVQFQPGLSMAEFMDRYGSDDKCEAALIDSRWPAGLCLPGLRLRAEQLVSARGPAVLPVHRLPPPVQRHQRHDLRGDQAGAVALVPGHAPADPVQEQRLGARTHAPPGRLLQDRLADQAQAHGGHARARGRAASSTAGWRSTTPTWAASARVARPDGARRTRCRSSPRCRPRPTASRCSCACVSSRSPTRRCRCSPRARSRRRPPSSPTACGVSAPSQIVGADHERVVTGGGKASAKLPQFKAINTLLGNLKRSLGGTYHAFDFAKYAHRYLAEAQYRFNRRFNLRSILARLLRAACLSTPAPAARHSCG